MFATRRAAVRAFLKTVGVWALTGTAAVCLAMLSDLGRLIGDIHSAGNARTTRVSLPASG